MDDYEDYYEDYDEDYDEFGAKPIVTTQKSKPKKNKKKAVIASEGLVSGGPIVNVALPNSISSKTSATAAQLPSDLAKGVPALLPTHPADILPIKPAQGALLHQKTLNSQLFAGLSDDDTEVPRHASHPIARSGDARDACLPCLAVIVAGHVDAGKSTLVGNLLYQTGRVSSRVIEAHQREAERSGKASFHFAWVTDESASEREHGVTISAATKYVDNIIVFLFL